MIKKCQKINLQEPQRNSNATTNFVNLIRTSTVYLQARVSDDYHYKRPDQWKIGVTSIFASAMELYPSKDTFWTSTQQPGNPYSKPKMLAVVLYLHVYRILKTIQNYVEKISRLYLYKIANRLPPFNV